MKQFYLINIRKFLLFSILFILIISFSYGIVKAQEEVEENEEIVRLAVLPLKGTNVPEEEAEVFTNRLQHLLRETKLYNIIERGQMTEILGEQQFTQSGLCNSDECAVEIGQLLSAEQILVGEVAMIGNLYTIQIRIINIETSEVLASEYEDCPCEIDKVLTETLPSVTKKLISSITGKSIYASLKIESKPANAMVKIDGEEKGITPLTIDNLTTGEHKVEIKLKGYAKQIKHINIEAGEESIISIQLLKLIETTTMGIKMGLNSANQNGEYRKDYDDFENVEFTSKMGFHIGAFISFRLTNAIRFQPELLFNIKGNIRNFEYTANDTLFVCEYNRDIVYLDIPFLLKVVMPTTGIRPNIFIGPSLNFKVGGNYKNEIKGNGNTIVTEGDLGVYKSIDPSLIIGAGLDFPFGLLIDMRYIIGVSSIHDPIEGYEEKDIKNRTIGLGIGYSF